MTSENSIQSVCSTSAMARKLALSRSRFYELLNKGIFPEPVNCSGSSHKFYTLDLQQQCLQVNPTFADNG
jgi:predicted DNA-binding transcriptional regulator AlpA